jgi:geranylgeranyl diphosphate synthase, type I
VRGQATREAVSYSRQLARRPNREMEHDSLGTESSTTHPPATVIAHDLSQAQLDALLEPELDAALRTLDGPATLLGGMARYHLGRVDADFRETAIDTSLRGKRVRPGVAFLCCAASGGDPRAAAPLAAALELLHNFTLVHDDIQDESPSRRHRPTLWKLWGVGQAINAGDALFAAAKLALLRLNLSPELNLRLAESFNRMTIEIVAGQVLDLGFEGRDDVGADDYLRMIAGKTSAIVRHAAWAGALVGGAADETAGQFAEFGLALGLGFQIRDDVLGIWGASSATGKAEADDIRRRKQSLPILLLRSRVDENERAELQRLYSQSEIDDRGTQFVLDLLDEYNVRQSVELQISAYHDAAHAHLATATRQHASPGRTALEGLIGALSMRAS